MSDITEDGKHYEQLIQNICAVFPLLQTSEAKVNIQSCQSRIDMVVQIGGNFIRSASIDSGFQNQNPRYMINMYRLITSISIVNLYMAYLAGKVNDTLTQRVLMGLYYIFYYSKLEGAVSEFSAFVF